MLLYYIASVENSVKLRRATTSVDLGDLKQRLAEVSKEAGVPPSTWLRQLVRRELAHPSAEGSVRAQPAIGDETEGVSQGQGVYRAWLDAGLTAKLDLLTEGGRFRSRAAALRALLNGVNMGSTAPDSLPTAVDQLGLSNHRLVTIARNVNQIANALNDGRPSTVASRLALDEAVGTIHAHLEAVAVLVGELRPLLRNRAKS